MKQATMPARLEHAAAWLQTKTNARPKTGLILGSGLGDFCDLLENVTRFPFPIFLIFRLQPSPGIQARFCSVPIKAHRSLCCAGESTAMKAIRRRRS